jgi:signal transduction histidine kinase
VSTTRRRVLALAAVGAGVVFGLGAAASWSPGVDRGIIVADLAVGWAFIGGGIALWAVRPSSRAGLLMAIVGVSWFAGTIWPFLEFLHRGPLFHLLATYPTGRVPWRAAGVGGRIRLVAILTVYALNLTRLGGDPAVGIAFAAALISLAASPLLDSRGTMHRGRSSAGVVALVVGIVVLAASIARLAGTPLGVTGLFVYDAVLAAAGLALTIDLLAGRWSDGLLTRAVVDLGDAAVAGSVRDRLARVLGDPALVLAYAVEGRPDSFVDETGRPIALPAPSRGRAITPTVAVGRQTGFVVHDAAVLDDPRLVGALSAAAALAMSNSSLQAEVRARVAEVAASRERLVQAADAQRRRLEQRLRSGAVRRLDRVAELMTRVEPADEQGQRAITEFREELDRARAELADFARGVHPATLARDGLAAALADLVRRTPLQVQLTVQTERIDPLAEATLYFVCSEALANAAKHAGPATIAIDLRQASGSVRLVVSDDGRGGARLTSRGGLRGLADRIEALGGSFELDSRPGVGTTLRIELPAPIVAGLR